MDQLGIILKSKVDQSQQAINDINSQLKTLATKINKINIKINLDTKEIDSITTKITNATSKINAISKSNGSSAIPFLNDKDVNEKVQRITNSLDRLKVNKDKVFADMRVSDEVTKLNSMVGQFKKNEISAKDLSLQMDTVRTRATQVAGEFRNVNHDGYGLVEMLQLAAKKFILWQVAVGGTMLVWRQLKEGITFINDLNKSMTNVSMITGRSHEQVVQMTQDYANLAAQLHDTISSVSKASEEFLRAGHNQEETLALIKSSTLMSKIAGQDQKSTADQLIAITNAYGLSAQQTMEVVDKLTTVDNASATSTRELGEALERTSASAQMAGVNFDQLVSYVATVSSVTRKSASSIGESFKTIFARMQDINQRKSTDEYGEDISNVEKSLRQVGIMLRDTQDSFKPMNQVIDETAKKWSTLTDVQQADVAKSIAGVRQRENFIVLMNHYNDSLRLQGQMTDSAGSAMTRYGEYAKSTEAKLNDLTNALQKLWMNLIHSETINSAISGLTSFIDAITRITSALGGLGSALFIVIPLLSIKFLATLYSTAAGAGILETALVALELGVAGLSTALLTLLANPVTWLIAGIGAVVFATATYINKQQQLKQQTEAVTKAQNDFNKSIKDFNSTLDTKKINDAANALENMKNAINYNDKIKQINDLKQEIADLQEKLKKDLPGDITYDQDNGLIAEKQKKLADLENQIKSVSDAEKQYIEQRNIAYQQTEKEIATYNNILNDLSNGHKYTAEEANKLIASNDKLSDAFKISGESADVNAEAINNLRNTTINEAINSVNADIAKTKTIINNSIDRTKAYILEAQSLNSLVDVYNGIIDKANQVTLGSGDAGVNVKIREQLEKNYAPLIDLYNKKAELEKLKGSISGFGTGGFASSPSFGGSSNNDAERAAQELAQKQKEFLDNIVDAYKEAYEKEKDIAIASLKAQEKAAEDARNAEIKRLDDELSKYEEVYNAKKKSLEKEESAEDYASSLSKEQKIAQDIQNQINQQSLDNSIEGRAKKVELEKQLAEQQAKIADMQKQRERDLRKQNLDDEYNKYKDSVDAKKDAEDKKYDATKTALEKQIADTEYYYDELIKNEQKYADIRQQIISGNISKIKEELAKFAEDFAKINKDKAKEIGVSFEELLNLATKVNGALNNNPYPVNSGGGSSSSGGSSSGGGSGSSSSNTGKAKVVHVNTYLNVRESANGNAKSIGKVFPGEVVEITKTNGGWDYITYNTANGKKSGWADGKYLQRFNTGGYTANSEGLAWLDKKEIVLKEHDTTNLLKVVETTRNIIANFKSGLDNFKYQTPSVAGQGNVTISMPISIENLNGDRQGIDKFFSAIENGMLRRGIRLGN